MLKQTVEFLKDMSEKNILTKSIIDDSGLKANVDKLLEVHFKQFYANFQSILN